MPILKNARTAIIEPAKFVECCLDPHHEDGRHKARVFKAVLGFERTNHADLIAAIRRGILTQEAEYMGETAHGFLWCVDMPITAREAPRPSEPVASTRKARMSPASPQRTSSATRNRRPTRRYRSLERVQLRRDLPEHGLKRGARGTIVHVFESAETYLVEFVSPADGSTRALAELTPDLLAPVVG